MNENENVRRRIDRDDNDKSLSKQNLQIAYSMNENVKATFDVCTYQTNTYVNTNIHVFVQ